jgi:hypothetical protein
MLQGNTFIGPVYAPTGTIGMNCQGTISNPLQGGCSVAYPQAWNLSGVVGQVDQLDQVGNDLWHAGPQCPTCGHNFTNATGFVNVATAYTVAGVSSVAAAGTAAGLSTAQVAIGYGESAGSPLIHAAVGVDGTWISAWGNFGEMTMMEEGSATWVRLHSWFQFSVPVINTQAVLGTAGATVSTCISGVCQALWNGWFH